MRLCQFAHITLSTNYEHIRQYIYRFLQLFNFAALPCSLLATIPYPLVLLN